MATETEFDNVDGLGPDEVLLTTDVERSFTELRNRMKEVKNYWVFLSTNIVNIITSLLFIIILFVRRDNGNIRYILMFFLTLVVIASIIGIKKTEPAGANDLDNEAKATAKAASFYFAIVVFGLMLLFIILGSTIQFLFELPNSPITGTIRYILSTLLSLIFFWKFIFLVLGLGVVAAFNMISIKFLKGGVIFFNSKENERLLRNDQLEIAEGARLDALRNDPVISLSIDQHYGNKTREANLYIGFVVSGLVILFSVFLIMRNRVSSENYYFGEKMKKMKWVVIMLLLVSSSSSLVVNGLAFKNVGLQRYANISTILMITLMMTSSVAYLIKSASGLKKNIKGSDSMYRELKNRLKTGKCVRPKSLKLGKLKLRRGPSVGRVFLNTDPYSEVFAVLINMCFVVYICLQIKVKEQS